MKYIFISYSSKNRDFALHLADDLERWYKIWIDREGIQGGLEWEQQIEKALKDCTVFVVIVSPQSNDSEWVARETILAEKLKKYRVPILINGELPFRLLNLHYVDFQGNYEGGLKDLLEAIKSLISPEEQLKDEANRLLGAGIQAFLADKRDDADGLIGQAISLSPKIAPSVKVFWEQLTSHATTSTKATSTDTWMSQIRVIEQYKNIGPIVANDDLDYFEWTLELNAPAPILDQIDSVKYSLHETFKPPFQVVRSRDSKFRLRRLGWGVFEVPIEVNFKDGSIGHTSYTLTFNDL